MKGIQFINDQLKKSCLLAYLLMASPAFSKPAEGFIENKGQIHNQFNSVNNDVLFLYAGKGINVQLRRAGYSYEFFSYSNLPVLKPGKNNNDGSQFLNVSVKNCRVDIDFVGTNQNLGIVAEQVNTGYLNYYTLGKELTGIYSYNKVTYKNIYKNTDIEFIINPAENNPLKYNIILHPGADLNAIQFLVKGAAGVTVSNGALNMSTALGMVNEKIPLSYYADKPSVNNPINFKLDKNIISFSGQYDKSRSLVIDPSSNLIWSTYYGGSAMDYCTSTGVDGQGNVYFAGHAFSTSNIATSGVYQSTLNGNLDAYLAKFDQNGNRLWASYFGGSDVEQIFSIFVQPDGNVYLCGDTFSTNNIASTGAHQTSYGGGIDDALLLKFDANGQRIWSTYFGNDEHDIAQAVTVDGSGNVIITGHTQSTNMATTGAYSTSYSFGYDVYVAKFSSSGVLLWCTYYGDSGVDEAYGVASDSSDNIYVTGTTASIAGISTPGSHQVNIVGFIDAFIAKFNAAGTSLLWGTYYGGSGPGSEQGNVIRTGYAGNIFVGGITTSSNNIATANACQTVMGSSDDSFITCFNQAGVQQWGTYFGGNGADYLNDMVIDANANLLFCGQTLSTNSISTSGAYQDTLNTTSNYDAYFAKFSYGGNKKLASYFGRAGNDNARGITVDSTGKVYIAGETTSTLGIASLGAEQPAPGGSQDGFLAKFCTDIEPLISAENGTVLCIGNNTLTATNGYLTYLWNNGNTSNPLVTNNTTVQGTYQFTVFVTDGFGCTGSSAPTSFVVGNCYVSIQELDNETALTLYPVPSGDFINLEFKNNTPSEIIKIEIYASTGQLLGEDNMSGNYYRKDLKDLPPGIYILRASVKENTWNKKFIKE